MNPERSASLSLRVAKEPKNGGRTAEDAEENQPVLKQRRFVVKITCYTVKLAWKAEMGESQDGGRRASIFLSRSQWHSYWGAEHSEGTSLRHAKGSPRV